MAQAPHDKYVQEFGDRVACVEKSGAAVTLECRVASSLPPGEYLVRV